MNKFRSKAFIKIKHSIKSANGLQLISCRKMIENANTILSKDEIEILKDYLMDAWDRVNPVGESFADQMESIGHKRL